jgi:dual specificity phosphatase 3
MGGGMIAYRQARHAVTVLVEHLGAAWFYVRARVLGSRVDASKINPQLWTGGTIEDRADVLWLVKQGVTADIDCQEEHQDLPYTAQFPELHYLWAPQSDDGNRKPVSWFSDMYRFAQPILNAGGVVLTHCGLGHNRGPSAAYFLLRAHWGYSPARAKSLIQLRRPVATIAYAKDADRAIQLLRLGR